MFHWVLGFLEETRIFIYSIIFIVGERNKTLHVTPYRLRLWFCRSRLLVERIFAFLCWKWLIPNSLPSQHQSQYPPQLKDSTIKDIALVVLKNLILHTLVITKRQYHHIHRISGENNIVFVYILTNVTIVFFTIFDKKLIQSE